ncbi:MAG: hypothetical protein WD904_02010 [Dehalococcoidia bacterium]
MPQTGPVTKRGKKIAAQNAFKHGIASQIVVIDGQEDPAEWEAIRKGIIESTQPVGALEHMFAERVALAFWKLRRLERWQAVTTMLAIHNVRNPPPSPYAGPATLAYIEKFGPKFEYDPDEPEPDPELVDLVQQRHEHARIIPEKERMEIILRYEAHYHRTCIQNLHELEAMQTRRKGGSSPLARLDIIGAPGG